VSQGGPLRFPWRVLASCVGLILGLFATWELIELRWFRHADPEVLHVLYLARGILGSAFTASLAAWILYRGHRRGLAQAAHHEALMVRAERLATAGRLAAGVAHEIGNPLDGALDCLRLAREGDLDPARQRELLDAAQDALGRIDRSIARFLGYARPGRLDPIELDLVAVVADCVRLVAPTFDRGRIALEFAPGSPVGLTGDADALAQVVVNLLLNAAQACTEGCRVSLDVEPTPDGVRVVVADDGPGIDPALGDAIYEPFVTGRPDGTGLGLSVSRRVAEAHGGRLTHRARSDGGTVFELWLPRSAG